MKKIRRDAFADSHPIVNLIYFIFVIGFAMMSLHPVSLGIAFLGAVSYSICLNGRRALYQNLRYMLPVVILTALINPAFSHQGVTILRYLPSGNPLTLESILYGIAAAVMLVTVLCWFSSFNRIMTSDKMIYLFGRLAPYLSIVLSMTLKFLPEFTARIRQVYQAQKAAGCVMPGKYFKRLRTGMRVISSAATWALERAVITGDSMKSRGYGLKGRTAYSLFHFRKSDGCCLVVILATGSFVAAGMIRGVIDWQYYPDITGNGSDEMGTAVFAGYLLLVSLPCVMHLYQAIRERKKR